MAGALPKQASRIALPYLWEPGEHLTVIGDTGSGKSTLMAKVLEASRRYVIVFRSKPDKVKYQAFTVRSQRAAMRAMDDPSKNRIEVYPRYEEQGPVFWDVLYKIWKQGGWTVYLDELFYLDRLGLRNPIEQLLTQGRSKGISVASGLQRPVQVTRFAMGESRHMISFSLEGRDVKTVEEAGSKTLAVTAAGLSEHDFAWYHRPTKRIWTGRLQHLIRTGG